MITLSPQTTALVLIDLQKGIASRDVAPHSGAAVVARGKELAELFRKAGAPVVLVNVGFAKDFKDALHPEVDEPMAMPPGGFPADFSELVEGLAKPGDILITKRQWGAFFGTELDLQLRRRGIKTIVLAGIATNIGVESTARQAHEHNYSQVIVEDATSGLDGNMHDFAFKFLFPKIGRVAKTADIALA